MEEGSEPILGRLISQLLLSIGLNYLFMTIPFIQLAHCEGEEGYRWLATTETKSNLPKSRNDSHILSFLVALFMKTLHDAHRI